MDTSRALPAAALAAFLLAGCATPATHELDVRGPWRVLQARSGPMVDTSRTRVDFNTDGTLTGHTGCNTLRGRYTLDGSKLEIGRVATTRVACGGLYLEQEDRILGALETARAARVEPAGKLLELTDERGRIVLRAMRWKDD